MDAHLSPSAQRAEQAAACCALRLGAGQIEPVHLLIGIAEQEEARGAVLLAEHGLALARLREVLHVPAGPGGATLEQAGAVPPSEVVRRVLAQVRGCWVDRRGEPAAGTDDMLYELLRAAPELCQALGAGGIDLTSLMQRLERETGSEPCLLSPEFDQLELPDATDATDVYRVLDAAANRAREGMRVLEDYVRFVWDDRWLTTQLKELRHQLSTALSGLPGLELLASRETEQDVGTTVSTAAEWSRPEPVDVARANFKRVQEAIRSLEEFSKLDHHPVAESLERMRYRLYTLERGVLSSVESRRRLSTVLLYVLVGSQGCPAGLEWTVRRLLEGGAQAIQLREKSMPDRPLVELARQVRAWTRDASALFIMNDRPDIARLVDADGVHLGQEELSVRDARRIVGPGALVGVSTHSIEQARQAVLDGANYIGVGPTFPSRSKSFDRFPGLELIRQVHREIRLPAFAIGGIDLDRLDSVLELGACRVAASAALCSSEDPRGAATEFLRRLRQSDTGPV